MTSPTDLKSRLRAAVISCRELDYKNEASSINENRLINALIDCVVEQHEALEKTEKLAGKCLLGTSDLADTREEAFQQGSAYAYSDVAGEAKEALTATKARLQKWVGGMSITKQEIADQIIETLNKVWNQISEDGIALGFKGKNLWLFQGRVINALFTRMYVPAINVATSNVIDQPESPPKEE